MHFPASIVGLALALACPAAAARAQDFDASNRDVVAIWSYLASENCGDFVLNYKALGKISDEITQQYAPAALERFRDETAAGKEALCQNIADVARPFGLVAKSSNEDEDAFAVGSLQAMGLLCPAFNLDFDRASALIEERKKTDPTFGDRALNFSVYSGAHLAG